MTLKGILGENVMSEDSIYWTRPIWEYIAQVVYQVTGYDASRRGVEIAVEYQDGTVLGPLTRHSTARNFHEMRIAVIWYRVNMNGFARMVRPGPLAADHRPYCCYFSRKGTCRYGARCRFSHRYLGIMPIEDLPCERCEQRSRKYPCWRHMSYAEEAEPTPPETVSAAESE